MKTTADIHLTENDLARKTGRSRSWILTRFAGIPRHDGLLALDDVLRALGKGAASDLNEARTREANARAEKVEIEVESLQKTRIPIELVESILGPLFAEIAAILKRHLPEEIASEVRGEFLAVGARIAEQGPARK